MQNFRQAKEGGKFTKTESKMVTKLEVFTFKAAEKHFIGVSAISLF